MPPPTPPPLPKPQFPYPIPHPAPITIRLITDNGGGGGPGGGGPGGGGGGGGIPPGPPLPRPLSPLNDRNIDHRRPVKLPLPPMPLKIHRRGRSRSDGFYTAWDKFTMRKGKDKEVVPSLDVGVEGGPGHAVVENGEGVESRQNATTSYAEAAASCKAKVEAIVSECRRLNQKYYDRMFNLPDWDTLVSLAAEEEPQSVKDLQGIGCVKRIEDIFDDPLFFEDGAATANDVKQGAVGDCWFLAAITALSGKPELIENLCVARDEKVGVYGFVFHRDGEWVSEVVDDRLALRYSDEQQAHPTDYLVVVRGDKNAMNTPLSDMSYAVQRLPKEFRENLRKGSKALYFGRCKESEDTWLPLIEKAYAKAHGDYQAIDGGVTGEGIEDLTGGIASYIKSENVLDKDTLWGELMQVNDKFLFGCGTRNGRDNDSADEEGFVRGHAYSVLEAREIDPPKPNDKKKSKRQQESAKSKDETKDGKLRLLKLRNPWGNQEWNGPWSDGSKEWTPEVMKELDHTFDDDGIFWISYKDFLKFYSVIDRIRLIGPEWTVTQQWTAVNVPWTVDYLDTSFKITITKEGPVVLVLSQPDSRYFKGLQGRYKFALHFRLYRDGEETYLLRSMEQSGSMRSCNAELVLKPGTYSLLVKVTAERFDNKKTHEEIIREYRDDRREKLLAVGKSFDVTHSKGKLREMEEANVERVKQEQKDKERERLVKNREFRKKSRDRRKLRRKRIQDEMKKRHEEKRAKRKAEREAEQEKRAAEGKERKKNKAKEQEEQGEQADIDEPVLGQEGKSQAHDETDAASGTDELPITETKSEPDAEDQPVEASSSANTGQITPGSSPSVSSGDKIKPESTGDSIPEDSKPPPPDAKIFTPEKPKRSDTQGTASTAPGDGGEASGQSGSDLPIRGIDHPKRDQRKRSTSPQFRGVPRFPHPPGPGRDGRDIIIIEDRPHHRQNSRSHPNRGRGPVPMSPLSTSSAGGLDRNHRGDFTPVSPVSSLCDDDFEWDSAMDGTDFSGSGSDISRGYRSTSSDEMYWHDPWQATCVIGLRVCGLDEGVKIEVVRGERKGRGEIGMGRARSPA